MKSKETDIGNGCFGVILMIVVAFGLALFVGAPSTVSGKLISVESRSSVIGKPYYLVTMQIERRGESKMTTFSSRDDDWSTLIGASADMCVSIERYSNRYGALYYYLKEVGDC